MTQGTAAQLSKLSIPMTHWYKDLQIYDTVNCCVSQAKTHIRFLMQCKIKDLINKLGLVTQAIGLLAASLNSHDTVKWAGSG